jgi:glycosyltransferase involved in cell wall biosynthesis
MEINNTLIFYGVKYFPSRGGTSRVVENLIKQLNKEFDVYIYCYKNKFAKNYLANVKAIEFPVFPFNGLGVFFYYLITAIHLLLFAKKTAIIHAHKTDCAIFLPLLKLKFNRIVATSHEAPYHRDKWSKIGKLYFRLMEKAFIHSGVKLTSISTPLANYYESTYAKKIVFIPNGINPDIDINLNDARAILEKYEINKPYLMFAARRIMSTKGLHTFLEALNILGSNDPVLIAGDESHAPNYTKSLKKKYKHLNLNFIGYEKFPVLMGLVKFSELFIFPSEIEGMSIMLLEVVSLGTPVICSDIPENKQIFNDEHVLFFRNKDPNDLNEKIKFAKKNQNYMDQLLTQAQKKINNELNWYKISEQYKKLYLQLR